MRKKRLISLFTLFQFPEKETIWFLQGRFYQGFVDTPEGYDLEIVSDQIQEAIGVDVKRKGQLRENGENDGPDDPLENASIDFISIGKQ